MHPGTLFVVLLMLVAASVAQRRGNFRKRIEKLEREYAAMNHSESGFVHSAYFSTSPAVVINECPDGWTDLGSSCLRALPDPGSFEDSRTACLDLDDGAYLALPQNANEQNILMSLTSSSTWIGVVRAEHGKPGFLNIKGGALGWENWYSGEPNDFHGNEDCVEIYKGLDVQAANGFWNDFDCSAEKEAVCQIKKVGDVTVLDRQIVFERSFTTPPNVVLSVTFMDAFDGANLRYRVEAVDVTIDGFRMMMTSWDDTLIYQAQVNWLAVPDLP